MSLRELFSIIIDASNGVLQYPAKSRLFVYLAYYDIAENQRRVHVITGERKELTFFTICVWTFDWKFKLIFMVICVGIVA